MQQLTVATSFVFIPAQKIIKFQNVKKLCYSFRFKSSSPMRPTAALERI